MLGGRVLCCVGLSCVVLCVSWVFVCCGFVRGGEGMWFRRGCVEFGGVLLGGGAGGYVPLAGGTSGEGRVGGGCGDRGSASQ